MILYIDCSAGASGDMLLAALVDLGFPRVRLRKVFRQLGFRRSFCRAQQVWRGGERALRLSFSADPRIRFQTPREMRVCLEHSRLPGSIRVETVRLINRLARAESRIHRMPVGRVHFHQLAGADTLAALVGCAAALKELQVKGVFLSPVPIGRWHRGHDGRWRRGEGPVARRLLRGVRVIQRLHRFEWTTPTAALLLSHFRTAGPIPPLRVIRIGRAVGRAVVPQGSGLLRLLLARPLKDNA